MYVSNFSVLIGCKELLTSLTFEIYPSYDSVTPCKRDCNEN